MEGARPAPELEPDRDAAAHRVGAGARRWFARQRTELDLLEQAVVPQRGPRAHVAHRPAHGVGEERAGAAGPGELAGGAAVRVSEPHDDGALARVAGGPGVAVAGA